jgi:hypothetical protein
MDHFIANKLFLSYYILSLPNLLHTIKSSLKEQSYQPAHCMETWVHGRLATRCKLPKTLDSDYLVTISVALAKAIMLKMQIKRAPGDERELTKWP